MNARVPKWAATFALCFLASHAVWASSAAPSDLERKALHSAAMTTTMPPEGYQSRISFGNSIVVLVRQGVIDPRKVEALYAQSSASVSEELRSLLAKPSYRPIRLTRDNARMNVNLLWALGLANHLDANARSPLNGPALARFASTGGWTLGNESEGARYFNRFAIVPLTTAQEALVVRVALRTFRPCCNNPTFFQDCNHGSALLGLLALGARQGLDEQALFREALAFNSFWFPHHYAQMALYFSMVKGTAWSDVEPRKAMSAVFSSAKGWRMNVAADLERHGLMPEQGGANCDV
jgi:hypothetical protein